MALEWFQWAIIIFLLLLPVLYELSSTFKYYAKFTLFFVLSMTIGLILMIITLPLQLIWPWNPENFKYPKFLFGLERKLFGISIDVRGRNILDANTPCIIVINHQSSLDLFGLMEIWPKRSTGLAKKSLKYMGPVGFWMWLHGVVFIDRSSHASALATVKEAAEHLRKENVSIVVFPEGTRNHGTSMLTFKKGAFYLAVSSQLPIVPVVFSSFSDFYNKRESLFTTGKFIITCLQPISTEGLTDQDVPNLSVMVREKMLEVFNQTSLESTQTKLVNNH